MSARQVSVRAAYMRGGTSKGLFFARDDLPPSVLQPGTVRDAFFLRVMGSPDPYGQQIDGMGAATSSTSKIVVVGKSARADCDIDFLFGQVDVGTALVDWSGSCGNLVSAVGPFAIDRGLVRPSSDGVAQIRIWQVNLGERIVAHVPVLGGQVVEDGEFVLDGVAFPAAPVQVDFLDLGGDAALPTGNTRDVLDVDGRSYEVTLVTAGNPTVFVKASLVGIDGTELPSELNRQPELLAHLERVRAHAAVRMGLAATPAEATLKRAHTPKVCMVRGSESYTAASGKTVQAADVDVVARIVSMGKFHHALTGTGAVALAAAASIPGTVVHGVLDATADASRLRVGHSSGRLLVGATAEQIDSGWRVTRVTLQRSARRLMDGTVFVPARWAQPISEEPR